MSQPVHRLYAYAAWGHRNRHGLAMALWFVVGLLVATDAEARAGGGQRYSRPSGGSSSGGGGGGGEAEILYLLIRLAIEVPAIGVPLLIGAVAFFAYRVYNGSGSSRVVHRTQSNPAPRPRRSQAIPGMANLRKVDGGFSTPVFLDFATLVHRRALEATVTGRTDPMLPFVSERALEQLKAAMDGVSRVDDVVMGGARIARVSRDGATFRIETIFENTRTEHTGSGPREVVVHERWSFRRAADAPSLPPADVERLGCPSCGAAIDVDPLGACKNCGTPILAGQLQWQVDAVEVGQRSKVVAPEVGWIAGGDEASVQVPVVQSPNVQAEARKLLARHPDLSLEAFSKRVDLVYHRIQEAWSDGRWETARPFITDSQFQSLRFWMDRYARHQLANRLEDVTLEASSIVRIEVDAWYESITVRIVGRMKDSIVDLKTNKVIGGNPMTHRRFAEYWTFLRAGGTDGTTRGDATGCPSCGAPLDKVNQAGVCGYCDTRITTGRFDWVLARIEQPEAYGG